MSRAYQVRPGHPWAEQAADLFGFDGWPSLTRDRLHLMDDEIICNYLPYRI
jgi:hypothetical protein